MSNNEISIALKEINSPLLESTIDVMNTIKYRGTFDENSIENITYQGNYVFLELKVEGSKYRLLITVNKSLLGKVEMVELISGSLVYFKAFSDEIGINEIKELAGFEPSSSWAKRFKGNGESTERSIFKLQLKDVLSISAYTKLDELLDFLKKNKEGVKKLSESCSSTIFIIEWRYHLESTGFYLEPEQLQAIADLGVRIDFHSYLEE